MKHIMKHLMMLPVLVTVASCHAQHVSTDALKNLSGHSNVVVAVSFNGLATASALAEANDRIGDVWDYACSVSNRADSAMQEAQEAMNAASEAKELAQKAKVPFIMCTVSGTTINGAALGAVNYIDLAALSGNTYIVDIASQLSGFTGVTRFAIRSTSINYVIRKVSIRNGSTVLKDIQVIQGVAFAEMVIKDGNHVGTGVFDSVDSVNTISIPQAFGSEEGKTLKPDTFGALTLTVLDLGAKSVYTKWFGGASYEIEYGRDYTYSVSNYSAQQNGTVHVLLPSTHQATFGSRTKLLVANGEAAIQTYIRIRGKTASATSGYLVTIPAYTGAGRVFDIEIIPYQSGMDSKFCVIVRDVFNNTVSSVSDLNLY